MAVVRLFEEAGWQSNTLADVSIRRLLATMGVTGGGKMVRRVRDALLRFAQVRVLVVPIAPAADPAAAQERTTLAWRRTGLALVVGALTIGRLTLDDLGAVVAVPTAVAAALATCVLLRSSRARRRSSADAGGPSFSVLADGRLPGVVTVVAPSTDDSVVGKLELTFFVVSGCSVDAPSSIVRLRRNGARLPAVSCSQPVREWFPSESAPVAKDAEGPASEGTKPAATPSSCRRASAPWSGSVS